LYIEWLKTVHSTPELDGGGWLLSQDFANAISRDHKLAANLLEMGCGPSWIGLWLNEIGLCSNLHLSDINPDAIACVEKTIKDNNIVAATYLSNMFDSIPEDIKFDCIVSNPPNYFDIQESHTVCGHLSNDIRPSDREWKFHKEFYRQVGDRLAEDGVIYISEVDMYSDTVTILGEVYDQRLCPAIDDFKDMIATSGLKIKDISLMVEATKEAGVPLHILKVGK
jgi:hypothetical protein